MTSLLRRASVALLVLAGLLAGCGKAPGTESPGVPPARKHVWEERFNAGDAAAIAALYTADGELLTPGTAPIKGRPAIQTAVEGMIKSGVKVRLGMFQNVGSGDLAYVYGDYDVTQGAGGPVVEQGTYVEIWKRVAGEWQIAVDINTPGTPVTPPPAAAAAPPAPGA
jgi:uncharacterized protein (TIGR02246 family)